MPETIILIQGKPGCGKSTCCRSAVTDGSQNMRHLPVGERFRGILQGKIASPLRSPLQEGAHDAMRYVLPPHNLVHAVVREYIKQQGSGIILVDGFPKEPEMLPLIRSDASSGLLHIAGLIVVDIDDQTSIERQLSRGVRGALHERYDATVAQRRVEEFNTVTVPVIDELSSEYPLVHINGTMPLSAVKTAFMSAITALSYPQ